MAYKNIFDKHLTNYLQCPTFKVGAGGGRRKEKVMEFTESEIEILLDGLELVRENNWGSGAVTDRWKFQLDLSALTARIKRAMPIMRTEGSAVLGITKETQGRKVKTFKWERNENRTHSMVEDGEGVFVQYGVDYEEFETGPGNFTTAIVEMTDGTVKNISVDLIQFIA